jgi:hypothetical protein
MSNKQMYFKVNVKNWKDLSNNEKCIVNSVIKHSWIEASAEYSDHEYISSKYNFCLDSDSDSALLLGYLDDEGNITWGSEIEPSGLIKHSNFEVLAIEDNYENLEKFAELEIIPEIDGVENTDDSCMLDGVSEDNPYLRADCVSIDSNALPTYHLRTSSFGMKFGNTIKGVYFKLALVPKNDTTLDDIKSYLKSYADSSSSEELQQPKFVIHCDLGKGGGNTRLIITGESHDIIQIWDSGEFKFRSDATSKINDYDNDLNLLGLVYCQLCYDENGANVATESLNVSDFNLYVNSSESDAWEPAGNEDFIHIPLIATDSNIDGGNIPSPSVISGGEVAIDY